MNLSEKINSFGHQLEMLLYNKDFLETKNPLLNSIIHARSYNRWFTEDSVVLRLQAIASCLKSETFEFFSVKDPQSIGIISEERLPCEEFFILLNIAFSGHKAIYKTGDKTDRVLRHLAEWMIQEIPELNGKIMFSERFPATPDRYYISSRNEKSELEKSYFIHKKVLFEARHQSAAILYGKESDETLKLLGNDIFSFFGQSAGNIKKIFIPENFDVRRIYEPVQSFYKVMDNHPYANNYQYQQSVYLMNRISHYDNGFLLLKEDKGERAPTGVLYYETYIDRELLNNRISQCSFYKVFEPDNFGSSAKQMLQVSQQIIDFVK